MWQSDTRFQVHFRSKRLKLKVVKSQNGEVDKTYRITKRPRMISAIESSLKKVCLLSFFKGF